MSIASLIQQHAATEAAANDFAAVAAKLNTTMVTTRLGRVGGKATLSALVAAGIDPNTVIAAMRTVPMASELLDTLTSSGVDWADPLTDLVMTGLVSASKITSQTATVVRALSERTESVAVRAGLGTVTADQCRQAWESEQLRARLINAAALATERMSVSDTAEQRAEKWATAWAEAV